MADRFKTLNERHAEFVYDAARLAAIAAQAPMWIYDLEGK
jgi:hypothetical protein